MLANEAIAPDLICQVIKLMALPSGIEPLSPP